MLVAVIQWLPMSNTCTNGRTTTLNLGNDLPRTQAHAGMLQTVDAWVHGAQVIHRR